MSTTLISKALSAMDKAGYTVQSVLPFWKVMMGKDREDVSVMMTHPMTEETDKENSRKKLFPSFIGEPTSINLPLSRNLMFVKRNKKTRGRQFQENIGASDFATMVQVRALIAGVNTMEELISVTLALTGKMDLHRGTDEYDKYVLFRNAEK
jgi:hypothetical protein